MKIISIILPLLLAFTAFSQAPKSKDTTHRMQIGYFYSLDGTDRYASIWPPPNSITSKGGERGFSTGLNLSARIRKRWAADVGLLYVNEGATAKLCIINNVDECPGDSNAGGVAHGGTLYGKSVLVTDKYYKPELIKVHPNPCITSVNVGFYNPTRGEVKIEMIDMNGKTVTTPLFQSVMNTGYQDIILNMNDFSCGFYIIKLSLDNTVSYKKLIINK